MKLAGKKLIEECTNFLTYQQKEYILCGYCQPNQHKFVKSHLNIAKGILYWVFSNNLLTLNSLLLDQ